MKTFDERLYSECVYRERIARHVGSMQLEGEHVATSYLMWNMLRQRTYSTIFSAPRPWVGAVPIDALVKDGQMGNTSARES